MGSKNAPIIAISEQLIINNFRDMNINLQALSFKTHRRSFSLGKKYGSNGSFNVKI